MLSLLSAWKIWIRPTVVLCNDESSSPLQLLPRKLLQRLDGQNRNEFKCVVVLTICFHLLFNLIFFAFLTTLVFHYGVYQSATTNTCLIKRQETRLSLDHPEKLSSEKNRVLINLPVQVVSQVKKKFLVKMNLRDDKPLSPFLVLFCSASKSVMSVDQIF